MKYLNKTFSVYINVKEDLFLINKVSKCCKAEMIRIGGSFRCLECDKYCEYTIKKKEKEDV